MLFFHNCGNVSISQKPDVPSQANGGDGNNNGPTENNPPAAVAKKVTDLYFCESYLVQGQLRYYVHPFSLANLSFSPKFETGNCVGHMVADVSGDGRDEFVHNFTNSTIFDCKLEVYNTIGHQLVFSKNLPGQLVYTDISQRICSGLGWSVKDQNNDGKSDIYYLYRSSQVNNVQNEKLIILDGITGQEITSGTAPSNNPASIRAQINDYNNDGLEDFLGYIPGTGSATEVRDVKIAIFDARSIWGMPLRTHTLPVHHNVLQGNLLKNKNGSFKYLVSTIRSAVDAQGAYMPVDVHFGLYDTNLNKLATFTTANSIASNFNSSTIVKSVGDFNGDGQDDVLATRYESQGKYTSYILNGQDLSLIQQFSGAWISQKLGRTVTDFFRTIGFAQADSDEALEMYLLVWEPNKISVIAIKNNGQIVVDKVAPSEWLNDVFQIKAPL